MFTNSAGKQSTGYSYGIHILNASLTSISGGTYYGSARNLKTHNDLGGVVIDGSFQTVVSGFVAYECHESCFRVTGSSQNTVLIGVQSINSGDASTDGDALYGILSDSNTLYTIVDGAFVSGAGASLGVKNYSTGAWDIGHVSRISGNPYPDQLGGSPGLLLEQDVGHGHNPYLFGTDHIDFGGGVTEGSPYRPWYTLTSTGITTTLSKFNFGASVVVSGTIQTSTTTFAGLPACNSAREGTQRPIADALTNTWGSPITSGGGGYHVLAYCDGTDWTVIGK